MIPMFFPDHPRVLNDKIYVKQLQQATLCVPQQQRCFKSGLEEIESLNNQDHFHQQYQQVSIFKYVFRNDPSNINESYFKLIYEIFLCNIMKASTGRTGKKQESYKPSKSILYPIIQKSPIQQSGMNSSQEHASERESHFGRVNQPSLSQFFHLNNGAERQPTKHEYTFERENVQMQKMEEQEMAAKEQIFVIRSNSQKILINLKATESIQRSKYLSEFHNNLAELEMKFEEERKALILKQQMQLKLLGEKKDKDLKLLDIKKSRDLYQLEERVRIQEIKQKQTEQLQVNKVEERKRNAKITAQRKIDNLKKDRSGIYRDSFKQYFRKEWQSTQDQTPKKLNALGKKFGIDRKTAKRWTQ